MQSLKIDRILCDMVVKGTKTSTVRMGKRDIEPGPMRLEIANGQEWEWIGVMVTAVEYKRFKDLTEADVTREGYKNLGELETVLKHFYPEMKDNTSVTIIKWE